MAEQPVSIIQGSCMDVLPTLDAGSVNCVVTSPPYWGLRDYGTATWSGGGEGCEHIERMARGDAGRVSTDDRPGDINPAPVNTPMRYRGKCGKCGAARIDSQLGLEPTPEQYVENLVAVFREVRRVLRDDGTVWLNLGDSYAMSGTPGGHGSPSLNGPPPQGQGNAYPPRSIGAGLKPKDLVGIPWRVAFALQADGWWLRSDIIWSKPNPMPESVQDRPTRAHEYVFLLSKSARYFYDADAIQEPAIHAGKIVMNDNGKNSQMGVYGQTRGGFLRPEGVTVGAGRNKRSVWEIATQPFPGAHFATFPEALVKPCILAGCPEGGTVLDPFAGSGTVGVVARKAGRRAVLIELSSDYCEMMRGRMAQAVLL